MQANCSNPNSIENIQSAQPLTWNYGGQALKIYKVPGTMTGDYFFDLNDWQSGSYFGGNWEHWSVNNGIFESVTGTPPDCSLTSIDFNNSNFQVVPNPILSSFSVSGFTSALISLYDLQGRLIFQKQITNNEIIEIKHLQSGVYIIQIKEENKIQTNKLIKK